MIIDICDFFSFVKDEFGEMIWWSKGGINFYWFKDYNFNKDSCNCFLMNGLLKYKFIDWLDVEIKVGSDMYFIEGEEKLYVGSFINNKNSCYSISEKKFFENNFSFLISGYKDELFGKFGGNFFFGGNLMERKFIGLDNFMGKLIVFDLFFLVNGDKKDLLIIEIYIYKKINFLYGIFGINYNGWVFLDVIFCNDWLLVLNKENCLFFYLFVLLLWVISDMVGKVGKGMFEWFIYVKVCVFFV